MKKYLSLLLALVLLTSCLVGPSASAVEAKPSSRNVNYEKFTDVKGHWADTYLRWAVSNGLMVGVSGTRMMPNANITRAQAATMITRAFGATKGASVSMFTDVKSGDWYYDAIARALQMGCLETFGSSVNPNEAVSRQEVAVMLVKASGYPLVANTDSVLSKFSDASSINASYRDYFATAVSNGLVQGYKDSTCRPNNKITRAQFSAYMNRLASAYMNKDISYTSKVVDGSLMVGMGGIKLAGMSVSKNLFLTDGVDNTSMVVDSSTIGGTVFVRGTGGDGLYFTNGSKAGSVVLTNPNNSVKLNVDNSSSVGSVYVQDGKDSVYITGNVGNVYTNTGKVTANLTGAKVDNLSVSSKLSKVIVDKATTINQATMASTASGASLVVDGKVANLKIDAPDSEVTINGTVTNLDFGDNATHVKFKVGKDTDLRSVSLSADKLDLDFNGEINSLLVNSSDSSIDLSSDFDGRTIEIKGDDVDLDLKRGAKVEEIIVNGDNIDLTGDGDVTRRIIIESGKGIDISIPDVEVYNKGGTDVYVGRVLVKKGSTVTVNSSGTGTVEDDLANGRDPSIGGDTNNGGSGSANGGKGWTITLDANGGSVPNRSYRTDSSGCVPLLPDAVRSGFTFVGWFTSITGGNQIIQGTVIGKNTTLYARWKANTTDPGNPGGGGDSENPGGGTDPENPENPGTPITAIVDATLPSEGQPSDFGFDSSYSYSSFGTGLGLDSGVTITGTVKEIKGFKWFDNADGYYVPVLLSTTYYTDNGTVTVGGKEFTVLSITSSGSTYSGRLIAYLPLNPLATEKTVNLVYDPDGAGATYGPTTVTFDYSGVQFSGDQADDLLYTAITAMPGIDGGETSKVAIEKKGTCNYTIKLSTENLLETKNDGRYGHWAGIRIPVYSDCSAVSVTTVTPTGETPAEYSLYPSGNSDEQQYVTWSIDAANKNLGAGDTKGIYQLTLVWKNLSGEVTQHKSGKLTIDLTGCALAGEKPVEGTTPCVSDLQFAIMTAEEYAAHCSGLSSAEYEDFGFNLKLSQNSVSGQFFPVAVTSDGVEAYYLPLKITGKAAAGATGEITVKREAGESVAAEFTTADDDGSFTAYALLQMVGLGNGVSDTKISFELSPTNPKFTNVSQVIHCENATNATGQLVVSADVPSGTISGVTVTDAIEADEYLVDFNNIRFKESAKVKELKNVTIHGNDYAVVWAVPLKLRVIGNLSDYTVVAISDHESDTPVWSLSSAEFEAADGNVLVPVAVDDARYPYVDIGLMVNSGSDNPEHIGSITVTADSLTLEGFTGTSHIPDLPEPPTKTLTAISVTSAPTTAEYAVGGRFSTAGLVVTGTYSSDGGTTQEALDSTAYTLTIGEGASCHALTDGYTFTVDDLPATGDTVVVTVTPAGSSSLSDTFNLKLSSAVTPTSIEVTVPPAYYQIVGETFDAWGMEVTLHLRDSSGNESTRVLEESEYTISKADGTVVNDGEFVWGNTDDGVVTVIYAGSPAVSTDYSFDVKSAEPTLSDPVLAGITLVHVPTLTEYVVGGSYDFTGLCGVAKYKESDASNTSVSLSKFDETSGELTFELLTSESDSSPVSINSGTVAAAPGNYLVRVTYTDNGVSMPATFDVTVVASGG